MHLLRVPVVLGVKLSGVRPFKEAVAQLMQRGQSMSSYPHVISEVLAYKACRSTCQSTPRGALLWSAYCDVSGNQVW